MPPFDVRGKLVHFTRSLGRLHSQLSIRVNCVCPGGAATEIFNHPLWRVEEDGTVTRLERGKLSAGSWLSVGQVVDAIMHAIKDESIFGQALAVTIDRGIQIR
ncbi:hypothetical protein M427DRAFT_31203 [Gonapodya prolifera JEL478]|uniref:NAD(P)-binding protein n=1 Tax=Gonapodya prolifera (strain JEL478) TaxID=1344416 RepID=A0A139AJA5_GONPJ|nr:hypothetical protein M427DRAFT_31203 [Gonapodya prolifera JEL478]|eukprot:KXS16485.1 hypothetical protein M427DRAFT_31203 [Gonapodya prolifera JEL478]